MLDFVSFGRAAFNALAVGLSHRELAASLGPIIALAGGLPDSDIVDRGAGQIELKSEILSSAVDDRVFAQNEFVVTQVCNDFVFPVFDRHGLPLIGMRIANAFAKLRRHKPCVTINRRVDLKVTCVDLGDAVVVSTAASHESQVGRLASKFEVELDDGIVKRRFFQEDSFGIRRFNVRSHQRAITKRKRRLKKPTVADRGGVKVV